MNIHVPEDIRNKYPNFEFLGTKFQGSGKTLIRAYNPTTRQNYHYSFEEDFFWFAGQCPEYYINRVIDGI